MSQKREAGLEAAGGGFQLFVHKTNGFGENSFNKAIENGT